MKLVTLTETQAAQPWVGTLTCDECGEHPAEVVQVGREPVEPDAGWAAARLCGGCLVRATALIGER